MDNQVHNQIVSFIWGIADDCLRDVYVRGKYRDVILPMTVIRRLDALLEDSKESVLDMKKKLDAAGGLRYAMWQGRLFAMRRRSVYVTLPAVRKSRP